MADIEKIDPLLKRVYAIFLAEAWFNTQRPTNLHNSTETWKLLDTIGREIQNRNALQADILSYIP